MIPTWAIILDYIMGMIMWTLIGRAFMNIFQREDSTFFFMRVFVKYTNPIIKIFKPITPSFLFGGFPWNLIAFSLVNYLEFIQILSITGTYAFNSLVILLFLFPIILFFNYKKKIKPIFHYVGSYSYIS